MKTLEEFIFRDEILLSVEQAPKDRVFFRLHAAKKHQKKFPRYKN
jgi:hypothetical protein